MHTNAHMFQPLNGPESASKHIEPMAVADTMQNIGTLRGAAINWKRLSLSSSCMSYRVNANRLRANSSPKYVSDCKVEKFKAVGNFF